MIKVFAQEFVAIANYLQQKGNLISRGYVAVTREELQELLKRNNFESSEKKLQIWKALHWIDTDDRRYTRKVYDKEQGRYYRAIKIDLAVAEALDNLIK